MIRFLTLILLISVNTYGQPKPQKVSKPDKLSSSSNDWKTLKGVDYSLLYPSTWTLEQAEPIVDEPGLVSIGFILYAPKDSIRDIFGENINLVMQDIKGIASDFNEYITMNEEQIKTIATRGTLVESKRIKSGTKEYHKIIYLIDGFMIPSRIEQFYFMNGTKAFTLSFTSEQTKFEEIRKTALKIVKSFKVY